MSPQEEAWIRDFEGFKASLRNFAKWFPDLGAVKPSDIDCILHAQNGKEDWILIFEFKGPGGRVGRGQHILHQGLRRLGTHNGIPHIFVVTISEHKMMDSTREPTFGVSGDWTGVYTTSELTTKVLEWWNDHKQPKG